MSDPIISNCHIAKLASGVFELEWFIHKGMEIPAERKSGFYTKAQLMKLANSSRTYDSIRDFLQDEFRSGKTIK